MRKQDKKHRTVRKHKAGPNFTGQHLLHNPRTIGRLLDAARLQPTDTVLEIGAGTGHLTFPLADRVRKVIAVEIDADFVETLRTKAKDRPHIHIVHADIRRMRLPSVPYRVVANIPFSITTPILEKLLGPEGGKFQGGAIIVEKGAARRFTQPVPQDPRLLSWKMYFALETSLSIPRTHFAPPPRVDAAVVRIVRRERPLIPYGRGKTFFAFAANLLRQPRMTAADALRPVFTPAQLKRALREAGVDRERTVDSLSLSQWSDLFASMLQHAALHRWPK